jgi:hypothetical protein
VKNNNEAQTSEQIRNEKEKKKRKRRRERKQNVRRRLKAIREKRKNEIPN